MANGASEQQTAEDIAAQKAARSAAYRNSQNVRNLIIALGVTLLIVVVVILGVPRGTPSERPEIDVAAIAANAEEAYDHTPLVADLSTGWGVNAAEVSPSTVVSWKVVHLTPDEKDYVTLLQGFDGDETWAAQELSGARADDTTTIDGVQWSVYDIGGTQNDSPVSYAIGTALSDGYVLLYGSASADATAEMASLLSDQIRDNIAAGDQEEDAT
ncbi:DUF4245 family protein [Microbacterium halotolerans]|uniref:DUF4245 family protein n=1 Tax=Microbacterium halotolerans TaxID=246613 RepID=UPI000E6A9FD6|nr:DUF4245 family protein [Microbacterium halotolerans]